MNLRVDLILESERRSASLINPKSVMRICAIIGPVLLVIIIGSFALNIWQLNNHLDSLKKTLEVELPKKERAVKIKADLNANLLLLSELEGWQMSRIDWADQLLSIQKEIPDKMQLETLTVNHSIQVTNDMPCRSFTMKLNGKAVSEAASALVMQLRDNLPKSSTSSNSLMTHPIVTKFSRPLVPTEENRNDRIFQIDCTYKPRMFE
jgi:hypothetical protein